MSEKDLLTAIINENITGFVIVDISPTSKASKFERLNYGAIFVREEVTFSMLPEWMQKIANEKTFPRTTLIQKMSGK